MIIDDNRPSTLLSIPATINAMSKITNSPLTSFFAVVLVVALMALFGPEVKSLGSNVRIVYVHGAWVIAAEAAFIFAALAGALGLIARYVPALASREDAFHKWSAAFGRTGIVFWVTYLPLSMLAMESNWNGLFLAEPRFRLALTFAIVGSLMQIGLWIIDQKLLTSFANIAYIIALRVIFAGAANIMHPPPSPIFNSGLWNVIAFFIGLNLLAWLAAYLLTRWFLIIGSKKA